MPGQSPRPPGYWPVPLPAWPAARIATVTYGRQVRPVTYPGAIPARVTEFTATDRSEDFTTVVSALAGALNLAAPGTSRILAIVSDGRYKGTQHADGQKLITRLAACGCQVIWIAPADTANTMTGAGRHPRRPRRHQRGHRPRGHRPRPHRLTSTPGGGPAPSPGPRR